MRVDYANGMFYAIANYEDRVKLKEAGFKWNALLKRWETANSNTIKGFALGQSAVDQLSVIEKQVALSRATEADINLVGPEGYDYRPYQKAGIAFALPRKGVLIGDQRGLGKTIQAIGVLNNTEWNDCLIVCPAKLRLNWRRELDRWLVKEEGDIELTSWDLFAKMPPRDWSVIIFDEAHYGANAKTKRGKAFKESKADRVILLTGTPFVNKVLDIYPLAEKVAPGLFASWYKFAVRYAGGKRTIIYTTGGKKKDIFKTEGATNLDELNDVLRKSCMVRRMLKDVEKEIPPLSRQIVILDPTKTIQTQNKKYDSLLRGSLEMIQKAIPFTEMAKVRAESGFEKIPHIIDILQDHDWSEKIVVFAWHRAVIEKIAEVFKDKNPGIVYGGVSDKQAHAAVNAFQNGDSMMIIGNPKSMGEGHTLTAARRTIVAELPWTPKDLEQLEGRTNRIGQTRSTIVEYYVFDKSIESRILEIICDKKSMETQITR